MQNSCHELYRSFLELLGQPNVKMAFTEFNSSCRQPQSSFEGGRLEDRCAYILHCLPCLVCILSFDFYKYFICEFTSRALCLTGKEFFILKSEKASLDSP